MQEADENQSAISKEFSTQNDEEWIIKRLQEEADRNETFRKNHKSSNPEVIPKYEPRTKPVFLWDTYTNKVCRDQLLKIFK